MHILIVTWIIMALILWFGWRTGVLRNYRPRVTKRTEAEIRESRERYDREMHEWKIQATKREEARIRRFRMSEKEINMKIWGIRKEMAADNRRLIEQNREERGEESKEREEKSG